MWQRNEILRRSASLPNANGAMPPRLAWSGAAHDRNLVLSSLVDRLAHNYRVVCFDRPGVRYSDRPCTRILDGHNASSLTLFAPRAVKLSIHWVSERARATADCCRWPAGSCLGRSFGYPSRHGMPKLSQLLAKASFASASSKQKRVPTSAGSIDQSTLLPLAMREASPSSRCPQNETGVPLRPLRTT